MNDSKYCEVDAIPILKTKELMLLEASNILKKKSNDEGLAL